MAEFKEVYNKYFEICKHFECIDGICHCDECPLEQCKVRDDISICSFLMGPPFSTTADDLDSIESTIMNYKFHIDWSKVAIDTPILINGKDRRHFSHYDNSEHKIYYFSSGLSSYTNADNPVCFYELEDAVELWEE